MTYPIGPNAILLQLLPEMKVEVRSDTEGVTRVELPGTNVSFAFDTNEIRVGYYHQFDCYYLVISTLIGQEMLVVTTQEAFDKSGGN